MLPAGSARNCATTGRGARTSSASLHTQSQTFSHSPLATRELPTTNLRYATLLFYASWSLYLRNNLPYLISMDWTTPIPTRVLAPCFRMLAACVPHLNDSSTCHSQPTLIVAHRLQGHGMLQRLTHRSSCCYAPFSSQQSFIADCCLLMAETDGKFLPAGERAPLPWLRTR